jgi:hypothetical protein
MLLSYHFATPRWFYKTRPEDARLERIAADPLWTLRDFRCWLGESGDLFRDMEDRGLNLLLQEQEGVIRRSRVQSQE